MKNIIFVTLFVVIVLTCTESRKTSSSRSRSSGSGRGSSRKTNYNPQPVPTSFSSPQASAPKPSLFGWQEKPSQARNTHTYPAKQPNPSTGQNHGYPSSQTGLSGNTPVKQPPSYQESIQRNSAPQNAQRPQTNNQPSHAYPASNGLSGSSGSASYPQGSGLSGSVPGTAQRPAAGYPQTNGAVGTGVGYPHGTGASGVGGAPPPYSGYKPGAAGNYPASGASHNYHPQGPPPPYSNHGSPYGGYSGYGGHGFNPSPQMPGYFGNYGGNYGGGFGGMSRSRSGISGLGLAGAGIGTVLTGLALWNLARSTGHHHHTVIYDNRGQPVAVAPANGTADPAVDSILKDLVNCTLTISSENATEVLAIPCAIATSFTPEADVKEKDDINSKADNTKCTVTVVTTAGKEFMTTIPCSILLNTAAENNVTEPPLINDDLQSGNATAVSGKDMPLAPADPPSALKLTENPQVDCKSLLEDGEVRDPLNPCLAVAHNLTVIPLIEATTSTSLSSQ